MGAEGMTGVAGGTFVADGRMAGVAEGTVGAADDMVGAAEGIVEVAEDMVGVAEGIVEVAEGTVGVAEGRAEQRVPGCSKAEQHTCMVVEALQCFPRSRRCNRRYRRHHHPSLHHLPFPLSSPLSCRHGAPLFPSAQHHAVSVTRPWTWSARGNCRLLDHAPVFSPCRLLSSPRRHPHSLAVQLCCTTCWVRPANALYCLGVTSLKENIYSV